MRTRPLDDPLQEAIAKHNPKWPNRYDLIVQTAAEEYQIPEAWIWHWLSVHPWVGRKDCLNRADFEAVLTTPQALVAAAEATGERLPVRPEVWEYLHPNLRKAFMPVEKCTNRWSTKCPFYFFEKPSLAAAKGLLPQLAGEPAKPETPETSVPEPARES